MTTQGELPDIVERLRAKVIDANHFDGKLMKEWDAIRAACLQHRGSDLPRLMFEGQIENFAELLTEAADLIDRLRATPPGSPLIAEREILWCCHIRGPDDVHAAPDYATALAWSDIANEVNWGARKARRDKPPSSWEDCLIKAAPAIWPWSPESHAESLPKSIAEFTPRAATPSPSPTEREGE